MGVIIAGVIGFVAGAVTIMVIACCSISGDITRKMKDWSDSE